MGMRPPPAADRVGTMPPTGPRAWIGCTPGPGSTILHDFSGGNVADQTLTEGPDRAPVELDRVIIRIAGDSGDGMQLTCDRITAASAGPAQAKPTQAAPCHVVTRGAFQATACQTVGIGAKPGAAYTRCGVQRIAQGASLLQHKAGP